MTQNEFDVLVSCVYNPRRGWPGVRAAIKTATGSRPSGSSRSRCARKARFRTVWSRGRTTRACFCWKDDIDDPRYPESNLRRLFWRDRPRSCKAGVNRGADLQSQHGAQRGTRWKSVSQWATDCTCRTCCDLCVGGLDPQQRHRIAVAARPAGMERNV